MSIIDDQKQKVGGGSIGGSNRKRIKKSILITEASLASLESLTMPLEHEVVIPADVRCSECQKRIADIISRMNETESVIVNLMEKKVTVTCKYRKSSIVKEPSKQITSISNKTSINKVALIKRIFRFINH